MLGPLMSALRRLHDALASGWVAARPVFDRNLVVRYIRFMRRVTTGEPRSGREGARLLLIDDRRVSGAY